jgi:hypothetical protein
MDHRGMNSTVRQRSLELMVVRPRCGSNQFRMAGDRWPLSSSGVAPGCSAFFELNQVVTSVDNFANGRRANLEGHCHSGGTHRAHAAPISSSGAIRDSELLQCTCARTWIFVLHQAAAWLGLRVSIEDPKGVHG